MKKIILSLALLLLAFTAVSAFENGDPVYMKFKYQGLEREYWLYLPKDMPADAPLVFYLHGHTSSVNEPGGKGFMTIADREKFAVCVPKATIDPRNKFGWNVRYEFQEAGNFKVDDVGFLCALAKYIHRKYGTSMENIFCSGISNGGEMCYLLAYERPDFFKAVAPLAGLTMEWMYKELKPKKAIPLIEIHGTSDTTSEWEGDPDNLGKWGAYISVPLAVQNWAIAARCTHEIREALPIKTPEKNSRQVIFHRYVANDNGGIEVHLYEIIGGTHSLKTEDLDYYQIVWDFFKKYITE